MFLFFPSKAYFFRLHDLPNNLTRGFKKKIRYRTVETQCKQNVCLT